MSRYSLNSQIDHDEQEGMHIQIGKEQMVSIQGAEFVFKCTLHDATKAVPRLTPAGGIWNLTHLMRGALAFPSFVETTLLHSLIEKSTPTKYIDQSAYITFKF